MLILNLLSNPPYLFGVIAGFIIGFTFHEFSHAWMANRLGDNTARLSGRLTLNPLSHVDLLGTISLVIIGFGWGKPVPLNPNKIKDPNGTIKVALSGVTANLIVALVFGLILRVATASGIAIDNSTFMNFVSGILFVNLMLIAFNIIPIPPLDGSKVIEGFLSYESIVRYEQAGPMVLYAIIIGQIFFNIPILSTVLEPIIRFLSFVTTGMPNLFGF